MPVTSNSPTTKQAEDNFSILSWHDQFRLRVTQRLGWDALEESMASHAKNFWKKQTQGNLNLWQASVNLANHHVEKKIDKSNDRAYDHRKRIVEGHQKSIDEIENDWKLKNVPKNHLLIRVPSDVGSHPKYMKSLRKNLQTAADQTPDDENHKLTFWEKYFGSCLSCFKNFTCFGLFKRESAISVTPVASNFELRRSVLQKYGLQKR